MASLPVASKRKFLFRNVRLYFREYCISSSIHGIRYFGERRTYFERAWWLIVFTLCLSSCGYFITMSYQKWDNSPIIISFSTREMPIYEIPFPAVTICPESKAKYERYSYSRAIERLLYDRNLTEEEYKDFSYMNLLCKSMPRMLSLGKPKNSTFDNYFYSDDEFFKFAFSVFPDMLFKLKDCEWMSKTYSCNQLFDLIITDEGICATFNMLDASRIYRNVTYIPDIPFRKNKPLENVTWTLDEGYPTNENMNTFPRRALFSGASHALKVNILEKNKNIDHACTRALQGFKVTLHTPSRVPRSSQQFFRLPLDAFVISAVKPTMVTTSKRLKDFTPEKRKCYFETDKYLKYFKLYTQRNCQLECLSNFTLGWCGCVGFFMPREKGTDICGPLSERCMDDAAEIVHTSYLNRMNKVKHTKQRSLIHSKKVKSLNIQRGHTDEGTEPQTPCCDCLPLCTDLNYEVETSSSGWNWMEMMNAYFPRHNKTIPRKKSLSLSEMTIYFKTNQFITMERHELYGTLDLLGNFGGLLGLFTGFSILSLLEIIYFLTIRIICNIKLYGNWSGECEKDVDKKL